jgi:protein TonB
VFGVTMASTSEVAAAAVPIGNSGGSGAGRPGAPTPPAHSSSSDGREDGAGYRPVSELDVGVMPEVDAEACGRAAVYPAEAEQSGIEGDVRLRVALNEKGGVHAVRVLSGLGHGLDRAAMEAIKTRCKFSAAIGRAGRPVAFVIESYTFHFQLPR